MRTTILFCLVAVVSLFSIGCVDSRTIHYYTIETPIAPVTPGAGSSLVLLVGNISVPPELQDGRIRYRIGPNEAGAYQFHRWTERPGVMVSESLVQTLRASGKYRSVLESSSTATGDYLLRGKLYEFNEVDRDTIQTSISLQVDLLDVKTKRIVWDDIVKHEEPVSSKNVTDVVASLDRNLRAVVKETAGAIDAFLAANH